jgi:hypothetical protein
MTQSSVASLGRRHRGGMSKVADDVPTASRTSSGSAAGAARP